MVSHDDLNARTRIMSMLAMLISCQSIDEYKAALPVVLNFGITPVEAKEIVYQAAAYLEIGRVLPFLHAVNEVLTARGISLPLEPQVTATTEPRLQAGEQAQFDTFGESFRGFWQSGQRRASTSTTGFPATASATTIPYRT